MIWMVRNIKDGRIVLKHAMYDKYYVGSFDDCNCKLKLFTTKNIDKAYDVLEITKYHWAGINVDGWRVVEAPVVPLDKIAERNEREDHS